MKDDRFAVMEDLLARQRLAIRGGDAAALRVASEGLVAWCDAAPASAGGEAVAPARARHAADLARRNARAIARGAVFLERVLRAELGPEDAGLYQPPAARNPRS